MFSFDEKVKSQILEKLEPNSKPHFLVDRYWDQLVLYLLLLPLQYLHVMHMLHHTYWDQYNCMVKPLVLLHIFASLVLFEALRIFLYYSIRSIASGESVPHYVCRVGSVFHDIGTEGYQRAVPMVNSLTATASKMYAKTSNALTKKA
ncbi:hypothetical protein BLOT_005917 [Blomia tropicalis]|nr:hypothetical protein BLOT_005917 [Blomia tropicalis]